MMKQGLKGRDIALLPLNEEYEESMTTLKSELSKFWVRKLFLVDF